MIHATIHIQRDSDPENDDILHICDTNIPSGDVFKLVYKTPDLESPHRFHMARRLIGGFVLDMLKSLSLDTAPFEHVQVTSCLQPSVLFHVSDLDRLDTRDLIEGIIVTAINTPCEIVRSR